MLVPELDVTDLAVSLCFYVEVLEFTVVFERAGERFAYLHRSGVELMIQEAAGPGRRFRTAPLARPHGRGVNFQLPVEDVDAVHGRAVDAGFEIVVPMEERWYRVDVAERSGRWTTTGPSGAGNGAGGEGREPALSELACLGVGALDRRVVAIDDVQNMSISLDGYSAGEEVTFEAPIGGAGQLFSRFDGRFIHGTDAADAPVTLDRALTSMWGQGIGGEIVGRRKFGPQSGAWSDDGWKGWWGDEPPFQTPVFVMSH